MPVIHSSSDEADYDEDSEEENEDVVKEEDEDEEAEETTGSSRKRRASSGAVQYNDDNAEDDDDEEDEEDEEEEDEEESESDDDIPLSALKSPSPKTKKAKAKATAKTKAKTKAKKKKQKQTPTKKKPKTSSSKSTVPSFLKMTGTPSESSTYASPSFAWYGKQTPKGVLVQQLLCRWWYAIEWPDRATLAATPPDGYDRLDGFPGVFICTSGDDVGTIRDLRDPSQKPSFNNFANKSSEELKDLLLTAITEQKRQLRASVRSSNGETGIPARRSSPTKTKKKETSNPTDTALTELYKWVQKVNAKKADKEAAKMLQAKGLVLSSS